MCCFREENNKKLKYFCQVLIDCVLENKNCMLKLQHETKKEEQLLQETRLRVSPFLQIRLMQLQLEPLASKIGGGARPGALLCHQGGAQSSSLQLLSDHPCCLGLWSAFDLDGTYPWPCIFSSVWLELVILYSETIRVLFVCLFAFFP